jgi:hypothetical protein
MSTIIVIIIIITGTIAICEPWPSSGNEYQEHKNNVSGE